MIILIGGEKGGTGKTTIAVNLAVLRARAGHDVLLIDTDSQGSSMLWAAMRAEDKTEPSITTVALRGRGLAKEIQKLAPKFSDVVIDAGGRDSVELREAMLAANLMFVPAAASQFDIHALAAVDRIVGEAQTFNSALEAKVVISRATTHASGTDSDDMREALADMTYLRVADSVIKERVTVRRAAGNGKAVIEFEPQDEKATFEMSFLYREVFGVKK